MRRRSRRWITLTGSDYKDSCQFRTHGEPCEIIIWDLIEELIGLDDNKNVKGRQENKVNRYRQF